jgi:hypothetical protein
MVPRAPPPATPPLDLDARLVFTRIKPLDLDAHLTNRSPLGFEAQAKNISR